MSNSVPPLFRAVSENQVEQQRQYQKGDDEAAPFTLSQEIHCSLPVEQSVDQVGSGEDKDHEDAKVGVIPALPTYPMCVLEDRQNQTDE
jgi:hypothetical protein